MQFLTDFSTFTEEMLNGKLHFLCGFTSRSLQEKLSAVDTV